MGWVIEDLIGDKDGVNKSFTISSSPFLGSVLVIHQAQHVRRVAGSPQPEQFQFGLSGTDIEMGRAPQSGEDLWCRYFVDS